MNNSIIKLLFYVQINTINIVCVSDMNMIQTEMVNVIFADGVEHIQDVTYQDPQCSFEL